MCVFSVSLEWLAKILSPRDNLGNGIGTLLGFYKVSCAVLRTDQFLMWIHEPMEIHLHRYIVNRYDFLL